MSEGLLPIGLFTMWLAQGERGLSSDTIVSRLTGVNVAKWRSHPYDPADFRRCEMLLRQVPVARLAFGEMRKESPVWAALVDAWDELVALAEEEVPGVFDGRAYGSARRTYERMQDIRDVAEGRTPRKRDTRLRRRRDTVHRPECRYAVERSVPWEWAEERSDSEVVATARRNGLRLCRACRPCGAVAS